MKPREIDTASWKNIAFTYPTHIPTMITPEERNYLYWLGQSTWTGKGIAIEIGSWLGGSTACLALGMKDSGRQCNKHLKVFDNFIWQEFMADRAPLPIKPGDSFEPFFRKNIQDFHDCVEHHARQLPDSAATPGQGDTQTPIPYLETMYREPVELLFVDGAKSWFAMLYLMKTVNPNLVPGLSYLVFQDYKYWGTYWVPAITTILEQYFEPVHNVINGCTFTLRLKKSIPAQALEDIQPDIKKLNTREIITAIDNAADRLLQMGDPVGAIQVRLGKVRLLIQQEKKEQAIQTFKKIQSSWKASFPNLQLERARDILFNETSIKVPPPLSHRTQRFVKKTWNKTKRVIRPFIFWR